MKGFTKQAATVLGFAAALFTLIGCSHYRDIVDPCWPERYNYQARSSVREVHNAQANRGHMLDQTIWNTHFETDTKTHEGTAKLTPAGQLYLRNLARRQPHPDFQLWMQYPHDVTDPNKREAIIEQRKASIRNYLTVNTLVGSGASYQIALNDEVQPVWQAEWTEKALLNMQKNTQNGRQQIFISPSINSTSK